jgi:hypothetical protein
VLLFVCCHLTKEPQAECPQVSESVSTSRVSMNANQRITASEYCLTAMAYASRS